MRTPAPKTCAPTGRRKLLRATVLRLAVSGGRGRRVHSDGAGSDPAVRGPATGSGPGAVAHPRPRPLGSLPDKQSVPEGCRAPLPGGGGPVRRLAGRRAVRHRRATTGHDGRGRQPRRPVRTRFRRTDHVGRPACGARNGRSGVRGFPPARGFRNTKTHLAPRRPARRSGPAGGDQPPTPRAATAVALGAMIAPFGAGSGPGPAGPPESCVRTCWEDGFAPLRGSDGGCPGGHDRALGIAMTYNQGTVSGGVNNRRDGDVQRILEPSQRRTDLRQRCLRRQRPNGARCSRAGGPAPRPGSCAP